jgi:DNA-binding NtrC family response regulator
VKRILVVDDEPDFLETAEENLSSYDVQTADSYEKARTLIVTEMYDLVLLDIMGIRGLDLLDIAVERNLPAVMITARALDPGSVMQAMLRGAVSYVTKEHIDNLENLLEEVFGLLEKGESTWVHTMKRLAPILDAHFSPDWRDAYKDMGLRDL